MQRTHLAVRDTVWRRFLRERKTIPSLVVLGVFLTGAVLAPLLSTHDPNAVNLRSGVLRPPGPNHWLGTDELGRDLFARLLYGTRISLSVAALAVGLAFLIGFPAGVVSGYRGGAVDAVIMRIVDAVLAFPPIVLAAALAATFGEGFRSVIIAVAFLAVPTYARLTRGQVLQAVQLGYVEASRAIGCPALSLIGRHLLPNILSPLVVQSTLFAAQAILLEATLSFLGVGIQLPTPSWGVMIKAGSGYLAAAPWTVFVPGAAIFLSVLALNLLGDTLRDAIDPRLR